MEQQTSQIIIEETRSDGRLLIYYKGKQYVMTREQIDDLKNKGYQVQETLKVICTNKIRNKHGIIMGYNIKTPQGDYAVQAQNVKNLIRERKINCLNLTLTSDNRLIDKKIEDNRKTNKITEAVQAQKEPKVQSKPMYRQVISLEDLRLISKSIIDIAAGDKVKRVDLCFTGLKLPAGSNYAVINIPKYRILKTSGDNCTRIIVSSQNNNTILCFPEDSRGLFQMQISVQFRKVGLQIRQLVLSGLDWSETVYAEEMFLYLPASSIEISKSKAPKLTTLYLCFGYSTVERLDLQTFICPSVYRTTMMCYNCNRLKTSNAKLDGLNLQHAEYIGAMFVGCIYCENCNYDEDEVCNFKPNYTYRTPNDYDRIRENVYSGHTINIKNHERKSRGKQKSIASDKSRLNMIGTGMILQLLSLTDPSNI